MDAAVLSVGVVQLLVLLYFIFALARVADSTRDTAADTAKILLEVQRLAALQEDAVRQLAYLAKCAEREAKRGKGTPQAST